MLPRSKRLNLKTNFKWVTSGKRIDTRYLTLFVKFGDNTNARVGIAVSSKYFKKASQRNRARRLISAAFEALYKNLPSSVNIVALPKAGILEVKSQDTLLDLNKKLKHEKIIN